MNPNQIIAALLDIASAAYTLNHGASTSTMNFALHDLHDLGAKLAVLDALPQPEGQALTGPARARIALSSFLIGEQQEPVTLEASCWLCADTGLAFGKVCEHPSQIDRRVRPRFVIPAVVPRDPTAATISRLIEDQKTHGDAELLGKLRDLFDHGGDSAVLITRFTTPSELRPEWNLKVMGRIEVNRNYQSTSMHQAIAAAHDGERDLFQPEPEECAFCGVTIVDPCEHPPADICERAINAANAKAMTGSFSVTQKAEPEVSNPPTCDDALRALDEFENTYLGTPSELETVRTFLNRLTKMAEPESIIGSDERGYVIEGAYQHGFGHIDDNGDLLVVHNNDLIRYVLVNRAAATPEYLARKDRKITALTNVCTSEQIAQAMREFERMNSDKTVVIDLDHVAMTQIRDTYIEVFGPLDPNITGNDIDWHVCEIIKTALERDPQKLPNFRLIYSSEPKPGQLIYPAEFNDHLKQILGTMCFHVINYMSIYRKSGFNIPTGAEHEQAFMIDRLLRAYLAHGDKWAEVVNTEMRELHAKLQKGEQS